MAQSSTYYAPLIAAWNSTTQLPPAGATGVGLTSTMTTSEKLADVNGWVITGVVPASIFVTGPAIANCIVFSEFNALTAAQQSNILALCESPGPLLGGSANTGLLPTGMLLNAFSSVSQTRANLVALAKGAQTPWWQANGYGSQISPTDLSMAGGLT
jgi:hypothetical protein